MNFEDKLITLRKRKGLSQEDLASELNVSRQSVFKWESGQNTPDISKLKKIAQLFEVSLDFLLDDNQTFKEKEIEIKKEATIEPFQLESIKKSTMINFVLGLILSIVFFIMEVVVLFAFPGIILKVVFFMLFFSGLIIGVGNLVIHFLMHNDKIKVTEKGITGIAANKHFEFSYDEIQNAKASNEYTNNLAIQTKNNQQPIKVWMIKNAIEIAKKINELVNAKE